MINEVIKQFCYPIVIFTIALFSSVSWAAEAPKPRFYRARIICADDINCGRAVGLFNRAAAYIKSAVNVDIRVTKITITDEVVSTGDYYERLMEWADRVGRTHDLTYVVLDGFPKARYIDFENEDVLGIVESIGGLGERPVIGMSKMIGEDDFTVGIMIHEIGHLLGATHIPLGIMAPSAQQNQYSEAYAIETIQQIREYLDTLP